MGPMRPSFIGRQREGKEREGEGRRAEGEGREEGGWRGEARLLTFLDMGPMRLSFIGREKGGGDRGRKEKGEGEGRRTKGGKRESEGLQSNIGRHYLQKESTGNILTMIQPALDLYTFDK
jgi:hypothetical protein